MDHRVNAMPTHRKVAFARLWNRQRFSNNELETLYGRYSCRLQQASVISCTVLLLIMGAVLSCLQFWYTRGTPTIQGVYLLLQTTACAALLAFLIIRRSHDSHLLWLAYALLALCAALCVVSLPVPVVGWAGTAAATAGWDGVAVANAKMVSPKSVEQAPAGYNSVTRPAKSAKSRSGKRVNGDAASAASTPPSLPPPPLLPTVAAAEGLWPIVFATFVAYALLPLPSWLAVLFGQIGRAHV